MLCNSLYQTLLILAILRNGRAAMTGTEEFSTLEICPLGPHVPRYIVRIDVTNCPDPDTIGAFTETDKGLQDGCIFKKFSPTEQHVDISIPVPYDVVLGARDAKGMRSRAVQLTSDVKNGVTATIASCETYNRATDACGLPLYSASLDTDSNSKTAPELWGAADDEEAWKCSAKGQGRPSLHASSPRFFQAADRDAEPDILLVLNYCADPKTKAANSWC